MHRVARQASTVPYRQGRVLIMLSICCPAPVTSGGMHRTSLRTQPSSTTWFTLANKQMDSPTCRDAKRFDTEGNSSNWIAGKSNGDVCWFLYDGTEYQGKAENNFQFLVKTYRNHLNHFAKLKYIVANFRETYGVLGNPAGACREMLGRLQKDEQQHQEPPIRPVSTPTAPQRATSSFC